MFAKLLSAVATALGGKYRVALDRRPDGFVLRAYQGKHAIPLSRAAAKVEPLAPFARLHSRPDGSVVLPPGLLDEAKATLHGLADDGLELLISPDVDAVRPVDVPAGFRVEYIWDPATRSIVARRANAAVYLGDGWFIAGDRYWVVPATGPEDDRWLRRDAVAGRDIVALIRRVTPGWRQRGLPYACDVRLDEAPALSVTVARVLDDAVELDIAWRVPEAAVQDVPSLPGYIAASGALMPGVSPQLLRHRLPATAGGVRLAGQQVPRFMRETWPALQGFAGGRVQELLGAHAILDGAAELLLAGRSQLRDDGVGVVTAVPVVAIGDAQLDAADVSRQVDAHAESIEYLRTGAGWLRRSSLSGLGIGPLGRLDDGTPLEAIRLSPAEVLHRGSARLDGPWCRLELPDPALPQGRSPSETAGLHAAFLRRWRLPGGIVSASAEVRRAFAASVASVVGDFPAAKVLVVGPKDVLDSLDPVWDAQRALRLDGLKKDPDVPAGFRGLVAATPRALQTAPALLDTRWSIVCLLDADTLVRSQGSKLFANLRGCRTSLVLGAFGASDFLHRPPARAVIAQLFRVTGQAALEVFERYGLRDPAEPPPALPRPYRPGRRTSGPPGAATPAELHLPGPPASGGLALPRRPVPAPGHAPLPAQTPTPAPAPASVPAGGSGRQARPRTPGIVVEITVASRGIGHGPATGHGAFVAEARRLVGHREKQASFVPFMRYGPTYDAMTAAQRRWYFYWRGQARDGQHIDTDLSYIFVHVYELINNVGVASAADGYRQLRRLWMGYRARYPQLDTHLADWLMDYLLANRCEPDAVRAHVEALPPGARVRDPDLLLGYALGGAPPRLPVALLEALVDYRLGASAFYRDGHQDLVDTTLPRVLRRVDAHLLGTAGVGVFDLFRPHAMETVRRDLFRSAVYDASPRPLVTTAVVPYSKHRPLRAFLTALVKHTENRLREVAGYGGRLRGDALEPAIQAVVDEDLGVRARSGPAPAAMPGAGGTGTAPPPRVAIDMDEVLRLRRESDEVRRMLLGGVEAADAADPEPLPAMATATPGGTQADLGRSRGDATLSRSGEDPGEAAIPLENPLEDPLEDPLDHLSDDAPADPLEAFVARLGDDERRLLDAMATRGWRADADELRRALPGRFLEPLIDRVNDLAIASLGDVLIIPEDGRLVAVVGDDLRDGLARRPCAPTAGAPQRAAGEGTPSELPAGWAAFASGLAAHQREALRAIVEHGDPKPALRSIADREATTPGLLIDAINEVALDTLGDYIVAPGSDPPAIGADDRDMVARLVAGWARRPGRA